MPELPEVETVVTRLNQVLSNQVIANIKVYRSKSFVGLTNTLVGLKVKLVSRRAKLIRFQLSNGLNILAHLKMTGQFIFVADNKRVGGGHPTADWLNSLPSKHTRVEIIFKSGVKLYFNDLRVFGWLKVMTDNEVLLEYDKYGPDINSKQASPRYFLAKLAKTRRTIKQVIMDNKVVAGIGNIYACDGLNLARINPMRSANTLTVMEAKRLLLSLKQVINLGIKLGGATISDYKNVDGFAGKYQEHILVYGLVGQHCKNCGQMIEKVKLGGRGTYYCPSCQV